jgi:hypothetical protein
MRRSLAAMALASALAAPAFGLTTLSNDQFTVVTSPDMAIVGGAVQLQGTPFFLAFAGPAQSPDSGAADFAFAFTPKPGHALLGETVTFSMMLNVDELDPRATLLSAPLADFSVAVDAQPSFSRSSAGGETHYSASWFVPEPNVDVHMSGSAREGLSCLIGQEANDCNFGGSILELAAYVQLDSLTVTPLISAVPEPAVAASWATALGAFALAGLLRRRSAHPPRRQ